MSLAGDASTTPAGVRGAAMSISQLGEGTPLSSRLWGSALHQLDSPLFGSSIAIHYGIDYEKNYVAWCQGVIEQLEQQMRAQASQAGREGGASSRSS
jgi:hypothetical protein